MKILLVDDSKSARYALRLQLQRHGVEVETAESAESAFDMLKSLKPDAILMDHMMTGLNGFEAFEVLRENPQTADIPVVMCTSHEESDFLETAKKKGVFGVLPKSSAPDLLPGILDRLNELTGGAPAAAPMPRPTSTAVHAEAAEVSDDAVVKMVDARLDARLSKILPAMLEELRKNLTEKILNEVRKTIDERIAADGGGRRGGPPAPSMADLQAISTRLATETVPDLIRRGIEAERANLLESVERHVKDARPRSAGGHAEVSEEAIALRVMSMARRESQETVDAALASTQEAVQSVEKSVQAAMGTLYGLIAGAAILGIAAAGVVFFLLQR